MPAVENSPRPAPHDDDSCVRVAIKIRPLIEAERHDRCQPCLFVTPGSSQVSIGKDKSQHSFTYDHVFGEGGLDSEELFPSCVAGLVGGLFRGYNATVFAYGQTGSGKTYTMGSAFNPGGASYGVIPNVMETIFERMANSTDVDFTVRVSFVEIHKEEIRDLLVLPQRGSRPAVTIREVAGGVCLAGTIEKEVSCKEEMMAVLEQGSLCRATACTGMNNRSSRSHAIFTISLEQRRQVQDAQRASTPDQSDDEEDGPSAHVDEDFLCAKMHLVDLAGSERAKRTKAEGARLLEGIHINKGLLALGNVIQALVERQAHIPYRDSKLTRLLQDSLGGNSRTLMLACVSPADSNFEETLNTLRYADRARHIHNKPVVNRDPVAAQLASLRQQNALLRAENMELRRQLGRPGEPDDVRGSLASISGLDALSDREETERLLIDLEVVQLEKTELHRELMACQGERDKYKALNEQLLQQETDPEGAAKSVGELFKDAQDSLLQEYRERIHSLETQLQQWQPLLQGMARGSASGHAETPDGGASMSEMLSPSGHTPEAMPADFFDTSELLLNLEQQLKMKRLKDVSLDLELKRKLEQYKRLEESTNAPAFKTQYDSMIADMRKELEHVEKEKGKLLQEMDAMKSSSVEIRKKLELEFHDKLRLKEAKIQELREKEKQYREMQRLQARTESAYKRLADDIQKLKAQKVQTQKAAEMAQKQLTALKQQHGKELLQLRKQGRKDAMKLQQFESLQAKQQAVLKRKTQEAEAARKRLKEFREQQQRNPRALERENSRTSEPDADIDIQPNHHAPLLRSEQSRRKWIERELDMCNQVCELHTVLDGEIAIRAEHARQLREVEKKLMLANSMQSPATPSLRTNIIRESLAELYGRKQELEKQIHDTSERINEVEAKIVRAKMEEDNKNGADVRRWNGIRGIVEAREMLRTLFRCTAELKGSTMEAQKDAASLQEQFEVVKLERDLARQEVVAGKRRVVKLEAAALQAAALQAAAAAAAEPMHMGAEEDAELEELICEAKDKGGTPGVAQQASLPARNSPPSPGGAETTTRQLDWGLTSIREEAGGTASTSGRGSGNQGPARRVESKVPHVPKQQFWSLDADLEDSEAEVDDDDCEEEWVPTPGGPRRTRRRPVKRQSSASCSDAGKEEVEVLRVINGERGLRGLPPHEKLTKKLLQEELVGRYIAGELWKPKNKNKEQMVRDYQTAVNEASRPTDMGDSTLELPIRAHSRASPRPRPTSAINTAMTPVASNAERLDRRPPAETQRGSPPTSPRVNLALGIFTPSTTPNQASRYKAALMSTPSALLQSAPRAPASSMQRTASGGMGRTPAAHWEMSAMRADTRPGSAFKESLTSQARQVMKDTEASKERMQGRIQNLAMRRSQRDVSAIMTLLPGGGSAGGWNELSRSSTTPPAKAAWK